MHAIIVGCGIAGLACAIGLRNSGHEVTILERAPQVPAFGAGINISPNASRALRSLGILDKILQHSFLPAHASIRSWDTSELLSRQQLGDLMWELYGEPFAVIHRYDLYGVLYEESCAIGIRVLFSHDVVSLNPSTPSVTLSNGTILTSDLVIGADGEKSVCREAVLGRPVFSKDSGAHVYRFMIPKSRVASIPHLADLVDPPCINLVIGPGGPSMMYAVRRGELLNVVLAVKHDEIEDPPMPPHVVDIAEVQKTFEGWSLIQDLVKLALEEKCTRWTLVEPEKMEKWFLKKVVLIGDAAHVMTPFVGQGAAMAIEDAIIFSTLIGSTPNNSTDWLSHALDKFYQIRHHRVDYLQSKAHKLYEIYSYQNGPLQQARDRRLREEMRIMEALHVGEPRHRKSKLGAGFAKDSPNFLSDVEFRDSIFDYDAESVGKAAREAILKTH